MSVIHKISNHIRFNRICVLLYKIQREEAVVDVFIVENKKNTIDIIHHFSGFDNIEDHLKMIKNIPVNLCIYGDGVIERIATKDNIEIKNAGENNQDKLIIWNTQINENSNYSAYFREKSFKEIVDRINSFKIPVHQLSISISNLLDQISLLSDSDFSFCFGEKRYEFSDKALSGIFKEKQLENNELLYGNSMKSSIEIVALSVAVNFYLNRFINQFNLKLLHSEVNKYLSHRFSLLFRNAALLFLLIILLFNYGVNGYLTKRMTELQHDISVNQEFLTNYNKYKEATKAREEIQNELSCNHLYTMSFLIDEIGSFADQRLRLTDLELNPVNGKIKANEKINIDFRTIKVVGEVNDPENYKSFLEKINYSDWVEEISKQSYSWNTTKNIADFELEILIKNE